MKSGIRGVRINGECIDEPKSIKEIKNYFKGQFEEKSKLKMNLDGVQFQSISKEDNIELTTQFTKEEIHGAMWKCEGNEN